MKTVPHFFSVSIISSRFVDEGECVCVCVPSVYVCVTTTTWSRIYTSNAAIYRSIHSRWRCLSIKSRPIDITGMKNMKIKPKYFYSFSTWMHACLFTCGRGVEARATMKPPRLHPRLTPSLPSLSPYRRPRRQRYWPDKKLWKYVKRVCLLTARGSLAYFSSCPARSRVWCTFREFNVT